MPEAVLDAGAPRACPSSTILDDSPRRTLDSPAPCRFDAGDGDNSENAPRGSLPHLTGLGPDMKSRVKVVLRNAEGKYLTGDRNSWAFTGDRAAARVFDYLADHIDEQLGALEKDQGIILAAVPVDPRERYEVCDRCGQPLTSFKIFFDGRQYLCPVCRDQKP
jgi:hypothetical protein